MKVSEQRVECPNQTCRILISLEDCIFSITDIGFKCPICGYVENMITKEVVNKGQTLTETQFSDNLLKFMVMKRRSKS